MKLTFKIHSLNIVFWKNKNYFQSEVSINGPIAGFHVAATFLYFFLRFEWIFCLFFN